MGLGWLWIEHVEPQLDRADRLLVVVVEEVAISRTRAGRRELGWVSEEWRVDDEAYSRDAGHGLYVVMIAPRVVLRSHACTIGNLTDTVFTHNGRGRRERVP